MSLQLDHYLRLRASGTPVDLAAEQSGIGLTEARLTEKALEKGELELPHVRARAPAREEQSTEEDDVAEGTVAADELRLLIERIERLHEERQGIADDIRDVFQEAKSRGYDTATMKRCIKLRKIEHHTLQEAEALIEAYMTALGMTPIEHAIALAA